MALPPPKPVLSSAQLRMMSDAKQMTSSFNTSWAKLAPSVGVSAQWGTAGHTRRGRRVAFGQSVVLDFELKADPKFKAFLNRLDRMPQHLQREYKRILRTAVRKEIIPRLRKNIPKSDQRKKHLRSTAAVMSVNMNRAIVGVGGSKHFYAAIVHAGRTGSKTGTVPARPFFPETFREAWHPLNNRLIREMYDMMGWLATGKKRRRF